VAIFLRGERERREGEEGEGDGETALDSFFFFLIPYSQETNKT